MAAKKKTKDRLTRGPHYSGPNIPDTQRALTGRLTVRLSPDDAAWWRETAKARKLTVAELMTAARAALEGAK